MARDAGPPGALSGGSEDGYMVGAGVPCHLRTGLEPSVVASGDRTFKVTLGKDQKGLPLTTVDLWKGETVLLISAADPPGSDELVIQPVELQPDRANFYGSPKQ